ncbi:right-handed parallel beta-helix repeat-containing protein [Azospirillum sp. sgz302134]
MTGYQGILAANPEKTDATTDPGVNDDFVSGWKAGSEWLNVSTGVLWKCFSAARGAAVWRPVLSRDGDGSAVTVLPTGTETARTLGDRFARTFDPLDYGVRANGSADDTAKLQATINAAQAAHGTVLLPAGTTKVSGTLTITGEVTIQGHAYGSRLVTTSATADIIAIAGVGNAPGVIVDGVTFAASVTRTGGAYVRSTGAQGTTVRNCRFEAPYDGIVVDGSVVQSVHIHDNIMDSVIRYGVDVTASSATGGGAGPARQGIVDSSIERMWIAGKVGQHAARGIRVTAAGDLRIKDIDTLYCTAGCAVAPRSAAASGLGQKETIQHLIIDGCDFDTGAGYGLLLGDTGEIRNVVLSDVWCASNGIHGVALAGTGQIIHVEATNLIAASNAGNGVAVEAANTRYLALRGGCIGGNTGSGVGALAGTVILDGVRIGSTDSDNVAFQANAGYGVLMTGTASYVLDNVTFGTNTLGNFYDNGSTGSRKTIVASPGAGKGDYFNSGNTTIRGNAGTTWRIGQVATTAHQVGNVGSVGLTVEDGGGVSGVFVENTHDGTFSSQRVVVKTSWGGVVGATTRLTIEKDGALTNGSAPLFDAGGVVCLRSFTVATLPSASVAAQQIYVSDRNKPAWSTGAAWKFADGATVS